MSQPETVSYWTKSYINQNIKQFYRFMSRTGIFYSHVADRSLIVP
jgi:hypothetical protein